MVVASGMKMSRCSLKGVFRTGLLLKPGAVMTLRKVKMKFKNYRTLRQFRFTPSPVPSVNGIKSWPEARLSSCLGAEWVWGALARLSRPQIPVGGGSAAVLQWRCGERAMAGVKGLWAQTQPLLHTSERRQIPNTPEHPPGLCLISALLCPRGVEGGDELVYSWIRWEFIYCGYEPGTEPARRAEAAVLGGHGSG